MRPRTTGRLVAALCAVVLGMSAQPAFADGPGLPPADPPPPPPGGETAAHHGTFQNCSVVSGPSYLGLACAGSGSDTRTVKQILGPDPVPDCWDTRVTDAELAAMHLENKPGEDGWTYYWERCLTGVRPDKTLEPGGMKIETQLVRLPNGQDPKTLTKRQHDLVDGLEGNSSVPAPFAAVSPADHPRVGQNAAFWNSSAGEMTVNAGAVTLRAHVVRTTVEPLGKDAGATVTCAGNGTPVMRGQVPSEGDHICWYKYLRSSAAQVDDVYHVQITSHWVVDISATGEPGTFVRFDEFDKSAITRVPVTEIQTLVVQ
ncbi:MAG TPA: hypothetical protein VFE07_05115 [Marmoricola sp.]|nr:hypothetical protein [Marmoricola sp.]